jgi:hypothetical protein
VLEKPLDEVQERVVGPMQILEHEHAWTAARHRFDERSPRRERLGLPITGELASALQAHQRAEMLFHPRGIALVRDEFGDSVVKLVAARGTVVRVQHPRLRPNDLAESPESDALSVRQRPSPPPRHARLVLHLPPELPDEAALSNPRDTDDGKQPTRPVPPRRIECYA